LIPIKEKIIHDSFAREPWVEVTAMEFHSEGEKCSLTLNTTRENRNSKWKGKKE
jgi:hypothetical protein